MFLYNYALQSMLFDQVSSENASQFSEQNSVFLAMLAKFKYQIYTLIWVSKVQSLERIPRERRWLLSSLDLNQFNIASN